MKNKSSSHSRDLPIYNHKVVEIKWQDYWQKQKLFEANDFSKSRKYYILVEFPYPSGAGLHVGHVRSWSAMDAYARKKRMEGYNVLFPMGWDAYGLPAENYAIKTGIHPSVTVPENIARFKKQCQSLGLPFDWSREINTTDSKYYKWTQWIFIQLFKRGLAYRVEVPVNWCPFCNTNLADEEVQPDGTHERCGRQTEKRMQKQWLLRITSYADRLLDDLKNVDFSSKIATQQVNWIGRKEWIDIKYPVQGTKEELVVSTTRPDTNFGATFVVISPEHPLVALFLNSKLQITDSKLKEISEYVKIAKSKSETERISEGRKKTGVFTGLYAINQLNSYRMPIYITDFVLMTVGTGAVVGVPGHDIRDFEFARQFKLPITRVVVGKDGDRSSISKKVQVQEEEGVMVNSQFLNGLDIHRATEKITNYLEEKGWGKRVLRYHLHDWIFSRQHYWGEPIPLVYCKECAKKGKSWFTNNKLNLFHTDQSDWNSSGWYPVSENNLPVELPYLEKYQPVGTGESPLATLTDWLATKCPECGAEARRETDTMPNWAGSNWYFMRYLDPGNDKSLAGSKKLKYWMPVDVYQGGFEHTTLHLLYSRFIYKFLYDIGSAPSPEPYAKRRSHGIVLGPDGRKMSKSFGNVVNPDEITEKYGADTLRLYEMFMGPFEQTVAWSEESLEGCFRFINRVWKLVNTCISERPTSQQLSTKLHQTIKKVSSDIEELKFNTAVSSLMEFVNLWASEGNLHKRDARTFAQLVNPYLPHLSEELWMNVLGQKTSINKSSWPKHDPDLIKELQLNIPVQINGKLRAVLNVNVQDAKDESVMIRSAKSESKVAKWLEGKTIRKEIFVPGKLVNFVV